MKIETQHERSPTDDLSPMFKQGEAPKGYDICGRRILHRVGRDKKKSPSDLLEIELFKAAMKNYRKRTGLKLFPQVWSFPEEDLTSIRDDIEKLNQMQGIKTI